MRSIALVMLILTAPTLGQEARARDLAAASAAELKRDPELAVLLARASLEAADVEPARTALYAALQRMCKCTVLSGHEGAVTCCDVSPDGQALATGSEDKTARVWNVNGQSQAVLAADAAVREVRFLGSADRVLVATDGALGIWNAAGGKLADFPAAPHEVVAGGVLMFPGDGQVRFTNSDGKVLRELAVSGAWAGAGDLAFCAITPDGRVRWYDRKGREKTVKPAKGTSKVVLSRSGNVIATFGSGNSVELWAPNGKRIGELTHRGPVEQVSLSWEGDRAISAAADGQYSFWSKGKLARRAPKRGPARYVTAATEYGIKIALDGDDHVTLWHPTLDSGDLKVSKRLGGRIRRVEPNPSGCGLMVETEDDARRFLFFTTLEEVKVGNYLRGDLTVSRWGNWTDWQLVGGDQGRATLYHWDRLNPLRLRGHTDAILDACFSADDRFVLTASRDHTARLWEIVSPHMPFFEHLRNGVSGLGFTTENTIVTLDWTGAHFWERDGRPIRSMRFPGYFSGWAIGKGAAFAMKGSTTATLYDSNGAEIGHLEQEGAIRWIPRSWDKADRFLTYSTADHTPRIWDAKGKRRAVLKHPSGVVAAAFARDGRVATFAEDDRGRIWSKSGRLKTKFPVRAGVLACWWSPKGDRLVTSHDAGMTLRIWTAKGKEVGRITGHTAVMRYFSFSPEGDALLTASDDKTARLWDKDGRPGKVLKHPSEVWVGMFLLEGQGFMTACMDGSIRHWDRGGKLLALMSGVEEHMVTCADYTYDGRWLATGGDDGTARMWPLKRNDLLGAAKDRVSRDFTGAERERYSALLAK
jgi:WD40 repeat protein